MTEHPWKLLQDKLNADSEYAWGVFCNIAVPIMDAANVSHKIANETAAHIMHHLWSVDITTDANYQYEKSGAQNYAEFRIAMDEAEDAEIAARKDGAA